MNERKGNGVSPRWEKKSQKFLIPNFTLTLMCYHSIKRHERTTRKKKKKRFVFGFLGKYSSRGH